ncbi:DUF58 domain-containing protein [Nitrospina gracilis]|uniref:DUF58 domain-containing protein n=1 Tax=Nitrospina gracilis TaxID=35801 RepID=UPI001F27B12E|nr:DUF58 domain-containing protein [Nitrospina gracilis]MCF8720486.1 uncharacterized protein (DUF58 family) [Nitrospina gracilis Nb-211]
MFANLFEKISAPFRPAPPPTPHSRDALEISSELIRKIRDIQVKTNHLVNHMMAGEYVSAFKGHGMEFNEVREYQPGDDIRRIDWNVTARLDHPFIKEYREERELTVMLMVDVSGSGGFGSHYAFKNEVAAEVASILAFAAIKNNDKVGLIVFSDQIEHFIRPQKGRAHIWNVIRTILTFEPEGHRTNLNLPLEYLLRVQKRKSIAFLISDFQAEDYMDRLRRARKKHDLVAIHILDPREVELPDAGLVHLEDAETGEAVWVDTSDPDLRKRYAGEKEREGRELQAALRSAGVDRIEIRSDRSLVNPIIQFFKMREKKH